MGYRRPLRFHNLRLIMARSRVPAGLLMRTYGRFLVALALLSWCVSGAGGQTAPDAPKKTAPPTAASEQEAPAAVPVPEKSAAPPELPPASIPEPKNPAAADEQQPAATSEKGTGRPATRST